MYSEHSNKLNDSRLNDSQNSYSKGKKRTFEDYEFVVNENSRIKTSDLGKGAYGTVKKVKDKLNGKIYAMKIMNKKAIFEYSSKENIKREITIQRGIVHPNVVRLYTYFEDEENVYLILEYVENGTLFHYLRRKKKFTEDEAFVYFFQTCLGIDYLHKRSIIHRDLKPENLLLDKDGNIKLCDFGWSADSSAKRQTFCGTVDYMAPEMIKNHPHDYRVDIWCLGILLYEMLHGYAPFKGRNDQEKCSNIANNMPFDFDPSISADAVDLIKKILQPAPINRLSMIGIFKHEWMMKLEKTFKIDIMSYVQQQDEQIKELQNSQSASLINKVENFLNKDSPRSAKIITIVDNSSPIRVSQPAFFEDDKKLSYNGSTKASETSSIGSAARPGSLGVGMDYSGSRERYQPSSALIHKSSYDVVSSPMTKSARANISHSSSLRSQQTFNEYDSYAKQSDFSGLNKNRFQSPPCNYSKSDKIEFNYPVQNNPSRLHSSIDLKPKKYYKNLYDEDNDLMNGQRMSKISSRMYPNEKTENKDESFIGTILAGLGCISRDSKKQQEKL